jgi:hypothetical protein
VCGNRTSSEDGSIAGIFNAVIETTFQVIEEDETGTARLIASTGVTGSDELSPAAISNQEPSAIWPASANSPTVVEGLVSRVGAIRAGPWPEPVDRAVLLPITGVHGDHLAGFMIAEVSPRRALDSAYHGYFARLSALVSGAIADAHSRTEERRRAESNWAFRDARH